MTVTQDASQHPDFDYFSITQCPFVFYSLHTNRVIGYKIIESLC